MSRATLRASGRAPLRSGGHLSRVARVAGVLACLLMATAVHAHPGHADRRTQGTDPDGVRHQAPATELAGQRALARVRQLTTLTGACCSEWQDELRRLAHDAADVAAMPEGSAAMAAAAAVDARWQRLRTALVTTLPSIRLELSEGTVQRLDEDGRTSPLRLVEGLANPLLISVTNRGPRAVTVGPHQAGGAGPLEQANLAAGDKRLFLVMLLPTPDASGMRIQLNDTAGIDLACTQVPAARLRVRVVDAANDELTAARLFVVGSDGLHRYGGPFADAVVFASKPELRLPVPASHRLPFFYTEGVCELLVPPGPVIVTAERGYEHQRPSLELEAVSGEVREVTLRVGRMVDAPSRGWFSGDTHVHWVTEAWNVDLPLDWLATVQRAEDVRVANNLTLLHRTESDAFVKPSQQPMGPVATFSDGQYHLEMAEEYRNQNLYGHLCLLNLERLILPIGTGPEIAGDDSLDYPINRTAILDARSQGGVSIEAHGTGNNHELPVNAIHGLCDSIDQLDPVDYERLLDCGFLLPLTNGSDHPARVVGAARAYVQVDGPFAYEAWIDGIRRARTFTSSGPLLFLDVAGRGPGEVIVPNGRELLPVTLEAVSRFPLGHVQLVANGRVLAEAETDQTQVTLEAMLPVDESCWVLGRASQDDQWNPIWSPHTASTSAVAVHVEGRPVFREEAAREWIRRMQHHLRDIDSKGRFANRRQRDEAAAYVEEAIRRFERRIEVAAGGWRIPDTLESQRERVVALLAALGVAGHDAERVAAVRTATSLPAASQAVDDLVALQIEINPEARVKLRERTLPQQLVRYRTERFLLEVHNEAGLQAPLRLRAFDRAQAGEQEAGWFHVGFVENGESTSLLSGARTEWKLIELRCDEAGTRTVRFAADAGTGTQDLGFRAEVDLVIDVEEQP